MNLNEQIKVMLAAGAGRGIQVLIYGFGGCVWKDTSNPAWNWEQCNYRVKQPPVVTEWFNKYKSDGITTGPYPTAGHANSAADNDRTHLIRETTYPVVDGIVIGIDDGTWRSI
jgi:hypothetical protein